MGRGAVLGAFLTLLLPAIALSQDTASSDLLSEVLAGRKALRRGDRGADVRELQRLLNVAGANPRLSEDGDFGAMTETAVRMAQRDRGLAMDGVAGKETVSSLLGRPRDPWAPVASHSGFRQGSVECYETFLEEAAARHGNVELDLLKAVIQQESRFDAGATSATGASGLGQFTLVGRAEVRRLVGKSRYAARYSGETELRGKLGGLRRSLTYNPRIAVEATALLLSHLLELYGGDEEAALTHYNAGVRAGWAVERYGFAGAERRGYLDDSQARTFAPQVLAWKRKFESGWSPVGSGHCPGAPASATRGLAGGASGD